MLGILNQLRAGTRFRLPGTDTVGTLLMANECRARKRRERKRHRAR